MIKNAALYSDKINEKLSEILYKEKYKYFVGAWQDKYKALDSDWNSRHFVSVDKNDNLLGIMMYDINRWANNAHSLQICSFSDSSYEFTKDFIRIFRDIFEVFNHEKVSFCVHIGNDAEKIYDKLIKKVGGRIIGVKEKEDKLYTGEVVDIKLYEVIKSNYKWD